MSKKKWFRKPKSVGYLKSYEYIDKKQSLAKGDNTTKYTFTLSLKSLILFIGWCWLLFLFWHVCSRYLVLI